MALQLKVGDVVSLKSGGPQMTVSRVKAVTIDLPDNGRGDAPSEPFEVASAKCFWFTTDGQLQKARFSAEVLKTA